MTLNPHTGDSPVRRTEALCPECGGFVPAVVKARDGRILLSRDCPDHGRSETLLSRHAAHYLEMEALLPPEPPHRPDWPEPARGVFINLTDRCNMACPNCLTNANAGRTARVESLERVLHALATLPPPRPVVCLGGGEPTLVPDLPRWIAALQRAGYPVKLLTNGLRLADLDYCRALKEAGLRWVLLQADSLDEGVAARLRGRAGLGALRARVLDHCDRLGFHVCLSCMIERDFNLDEVGEFVRFALRTPCVRHLSLLPARRIGRNRLTTDQDWLEDLDVIEALDRQTGGRILREDWVRFAAWTAWAYRVTGSMDFKPRRCFLVLPVVGTERDFQPVTRLRGLLDPRNLLAFAGMAARGGRMERAWFGSRALILSIEAFREPATLDLDDALRCSRFYLADGRFVRPCLFNAYEWPRMQRERGAQVRVTRTASQATAPDASPE